MRKIGNAKFSPFLQAGTFMHYIGK